MIDSGKVKNQSDLARKLGVSRVRVCQVLSLLKLDDNQVKVIEKLGDPLLSRIVSERWLRFIVKLPPNEQIGIIDTIIKKHDQKH